jgi:hypothetical protein
VLPPLTVRGNLDPMVLLDSVAVHWGIVGGPVAGTTGAGIGLVVRMPPFDTHGSPAAVLVREPVLSTVDLAAAQVSRGPTSWTSILAVRPAVVASIRPSFAW